MATPTEDHSTLYDLMAPIDSQPEAGLEHDRARHWSVAPTLTDNDAASHDNTNNKNNNKTPGQSRRTTGHSFYSMSERELDEEEEKIKEDYDARICARCKAHDKDIEAALEAIKIVPRDEDGSKLVTWDGPNDPQKPMNWSMTKKWLIVISTGLMTFCVSFASSVFSTTTFATAAKFGVSTEVMILGLSLYVVGFALGEFWCMILVCFLFGCLHVSKAP